MLQEAEQRKLNEPRNMNLIIKRQQTEIAALRDQLNAYEILHKTEQEIDRPTSHQQSDNPLSGIKQRMAQFIKKSNEVNRRF